MEITHIFREYDIRGIFGKDLTHEVGSFLVNIL